MAAHQPVHVAVRVRPHSFAPASEAYPPSTEPASCVQWNSHTRRITVRDAAAGTFPKAFVIDALLDEASTNRTVFETVCKPLLEASIRREGLLPLLHSGTAAAVPPVQPSADTLCFFAYGHTNSGKTHTIAGAPGDAGLLARCALHLLQTFGMVDVSMLEVYNERVYDLLAKGEERRVRQPASTASASSSSSAAAAAASRGYAAASAAAVVVEGLKTATVRSAEAWTDVAAYGVAQRRTSPNEHNSRSSRSHALFTLKVGGLSVCLVDLAGSERQTAFTKCLEKDSILINKSLSRLSTVVEALSHGGGGAAGRASKMPSSPAASSSSSASGSAAPTTGSRFVNFRDTVLTVLLQRYLQGRSVTTFIACVHPAPALYQETLSTMRYTARLKHVTTLTGHGGERGATATTPRGSHRQQQQQQLELEADLATLRAELRRQRAASEETYAAQRQRIHALEQQSLLFQTPAYMLNASIDSSVVSSSADSSTASAAGRAMRDTRRVTSWLLARCDASMPSFTVALGDSYFDAMFPTIDVVGYVSSMAMLPPADLDDPSVARCFLDTGDVAMGLLMLDAGIPPLVHVHTGHCYDVDHWASPEWAEGNVFVLAVFEVNAGDLDAVMEMDSEAAAACCGGVLSCNALVPYAVVFGARPGATDARETLRLHLQSLAKHHGATSMATPPAAAAPPSTVAGRFADAAAPASLAADLHPSVSARQESARSTVLEGEHRRAASSRDAARSTSPGVVGVPAGGPKFFGSLLLDVLAQARRSASIGPAPPTATSLANLLDDAAAAAGPDAAESSCEASADAIDEDLPPHDFVAAAMEQEEHHQQHLPVDADASEAAAGTNDSSASSSTIFFVAEDDGDRTAMPRVEDEVAAAARQPAPMDADPEEEAGDAVGPEITSADVSISFGNVSPAVTPAPHTGGLLPPLDATSLSVFAISALSVPQSPAASGGDRQQQQHQQSDLTEEESAGDEALEGCEAAAWRQILEGRHFHRPCHPSSAASHEDLPSTAEILSLPSRSPVDLLDLDAAESGRWQRPVAAGWPRPSSGGGGALCSVAQAVATAGAAMPQRRSPLPSVVDVATRHAMKPPTPTSTAASHPPPAAVVESVRHSESFLAFRPLPGPTPAKASPAAPAPSSLAGSPAAPVSIALLPCAPTIAALRDQQTPQKCVSPASATAATMGAAAGCEPFGATSSGGGSSRRSVDSSMHSGSSASSLGRTAAGAGVAPDASVGRSSSPVPFADTSMLHPTLSKMQTSIHQSRGKPNDPLDGGVRLTISTSPPTGGMSPLPPTLAAPHASKLPRKKHPKQSKRAADDEEERDRERDTPACTPQCNACTIM